jgi:hypothetical protein
MKRSMCIMKVSTQSHMRKCTFERFQLTPGPKDPNHKWESTFTIQKELNPSSILPVRTHMWALIPKRYLWFFPWVDGSDHSTWECRYEVRCIITHHLCILWLASLKDPWWLAAIAHISKRAAVVMRQYDTKRIAQWKGSRATTEATGRCLQASIEANNRVRTRIPWHFRVFSSLTGWKGGLDDIKSPNNNRDDKKKF